MKNRKIDWECNERSDVYETRTWVAVESSGEGNAAVGGPAEAGELPADSGGC